MCVSVYVHVCMCTLCLVPKEVRKGCWVPWHWSYGWLGAIMWVLRIEAGSCVKTASAES